MPKPVEVLLKSNAVPGVFGVFAAEPKEANAPDPKPKAEEAPGEATVLVFSGGILLNAPDLPGVAGSPPGKRRELKPRFCESVLLSRWSREGLFALKMVSIGL